VFGISGSAFEEVEMLPMLLSLSTLPSDFVRLCVGGEEFGDDRGLFVGVVI